MVPEAPYLFSSDEASRVGLPLLRLHPLDWCLFCYDSHRLVAVNRLGILRLVRTDFCLLSLRRSSLALVIIVDLGLEKLSQPHSAASQPRHGQPAHPLNWMAQPLLVDHRYHFEQLLGCPSWLFHCLPVLDIVIDLRNWVYYWLSYLINIHYFNNLTDWLGDHVINNFRRNWAQKYS